MHRTCSGLLELGVVDRPSLHKDPNLRRIRDSASHRDRKIIVAENTLTRTLGSVICQTAHDKKISMHDFIVVQVFRSSTKKEKFFAQI